MVGYCNRYNLGNITQQSVLELKTDKKQDSADMSALSLFLLNVNIT